MDGGGGVGVMVGCVFVGLERVPTSPKMSSAQIRAAAEKVMSRWERGGPGVDLGEWDVWYLREREAWRGDEGGGGEGEVADGGGWDVMNSSPAHGGRWAGGIWPGREEGRERCGGGWGDGYWGGGIWGLGLI